jgi:tight adherence protein B
MGALLGLLLGTGLLLIWQSLGPERHCKSALRWLSMRDRARETLVQAGVEGVGLASLLMSCLGVFVVVLLAMTALSRSVVIGTAFAVIASWGPVAAVRYRRRRRLEALREVWPEVVDNLASAVRAGMSLPEALTQVGVRGPETLRRAFDRFGADYRATGRFMICLDRLKADLADPVGDRVVESLRMAREVGGSDLGRLLRTLSTFLREDARARAELETRQGWSINAARLAVAAPWILLALLSLRPESVAAYDGRTGAIVIASGAALCLIAYRMMLRIARLPDEQRVLR